MRSPVIAACFVAIGVGAWNLWSERAESHPPGVLVPGAPVQREIFGATEFHRDRFRIVARAQFDITARVIGKERYRYDRLAPIVPVDLALGWQDMSNSAVLDRMSCSQGQRFYYCEWKSGDVIDLNRFTRQSANMHMIPSTPEVEKALLKVRQGQIVTIRGLLVDVVLPEGAWRTSLTRGDSGPGACEIVWVKEISVS